MECELEKGKSKLGLMECKLEKGKSKRPNGVQVGEGQQQKVGDANMDSFVLVLNMYLFIMLFVRWMRNDTCVLFCVVDERQGALYYINVLCYGRAAMLVGILF